MTLFSRVWFLVLFILAAAAPLSAEGRPLARNGVIDLSSCSLAVGEPPFLDGEWEFFPGIFLDPSADRSSAVYRSVSTVLPGLWDGASALWGKGCDSRQYGTFRLQVKVPPGTEDYYIHVPYMYSAYRLYVNGKLVARNGEPWETKAATRPLFHPEIAAFHDSSAVLDVRIHISNHHDRKGGIWETPRISSGRYLLEEYIFKTFSEAFLFGMLFIFGLYHICMHLFRREERTSLYFGLFCIAVGIRSFFVGNILIYSFFPGFPWSVACRIEYIMYFIMPAFFMLYSIELFPDEFRRRTGWVFTGIACVGTAFILVTEKKVFGNLIYPVQAYILIGTLFSLYGYIRAAVNKRSGAYSALAGLVVFFAAVINDLLFASEKIHSVNLLQYGFMFFIFAHSVNLSYLFAQAFAKIKTLSKALEHINNVLEEKVLKRTQEISEKNRLLVLAHNAAEKDLQMAVKVQMSVMPRSAPVLEEWDIGFSLIPMSGVSGDFYDFYSADDELKGVALFDVSGHGISSGLVTMLAKWIIFKTFMQNLDKPLSFVFELLGKQLPEAIGNTRYFLTGIILRFSGDTVEYSNAGHPDLVHLSPSGVTSIKGSDGKKVKGRLLGCRAIRSEYESVSLRILKDEYLLLMTDGILEAENERREQFGIERMEKALSSVCSMSAQSVCDYLVEQVAVFRGSASQSDDISLIVIRRR
jgi:serine phosphatase RsbU (regulator of sigma subunit)